MQNSSLIVSKIYLSLIVYSIFTNTYLLAIRKYSRQDLIKLREEVREMFEHAYSGYIKYAYPYDELRPLTCDGVDTWGSYSLTLIDALDTLAVMGNYSEFRRVVDIVTTTANFDANINVSVFETNIRIVGGLLSAHLLSQRAGIEVEPGWPCNGPLLRLAEDVAQRLLAAFNTKTGMPLGTVNLRYGVPPGETPVTCTAGVGTFILEFATLSRLTGDPIYEEVAMNALRVLFLHRSTIGLFGNHIDVMSGRWIARDSGIGAGVDSYLEYLVKGSILLHKPELMAMFSEARRPIDKYLRKNHWYVWASMHKGQVTLPVFQSLEAYWPGVLTLIGDIESALRSMHNYNSVWKQYGFTPEFYNIAQGEAGTNRESYPLRPELAESAMYLYRATGDPFMLDVGLNILRSIQHSAKTSCGYATIKDTRDHTQENRMESFFLAETTKYLYLLFDPDNFIHNKGEHGRIHTLPSGKQCILDSGGYIFNTEAHPIDPGALNCCYDWEQQYFNEANSLKFKGDALKNKPQKLNKTDKDTNGNVQDVEVNGESAGTSSDVLVSGEWKEIKSFEPEEEVSKQENLINDGINKIISLDTDESSEDTNDIKILINKKKKIYNLLQETMIKHKKLIESLLVTFEGIPNEETTSNSGDNDSSNNGKYGTKSKEKSIHLLKKLLNFMQTSHHKIVNKLRRLSTVSKENTSTNSDKSKNVKSVELINLLTNDNLNSILNEINEKVNKIVEGLEKLSNVENLELEPEINAINESLTEDVQLEEESTSDNNASLLDAANATAQSAGLNKEHEPTFHQNDDGMTTTETSWIESNLSETPSETSSATSDAISLSDYIRQLILSVPQSSTKFDPQQLLYNIRQNSIYYTNLTLANRYQLLTCKAQPFLIRITIAGEFLNEK